MTKPTRFAPVFSQDLIERQHRRAGRDAGGPGDPLAEPHVRSKPASRMKCVPGDHVDLGVRERFGRSKISESRTAQRRPGQRGFGDLKREKCADTSGRPDIAVVTGSGGRRRRRGQSQENTVRHRLLCTPSAGRTLTAVGAPENPEGGISLLANPSARGSSHGPRASPQAVCKPPKQVADWRGFGRRQDRRMGDR